MAEGLLDKANIILTPTGYKAGTMYNVAPIEQPYEDFDFARASVASRVNSSGLVEMVGRTLGSNLVQNGDFSELGDNVVTNGTFDTDSDWTIQNNTGTDTEITSGNLIIETDGAYTQVSQSSILVGGNQYKLIYTILSSDNGDLGLVTEGNLTVSIPSSVGTHTYYFTAHSTSFILKRRGGALNVTIDNVSIQQVDPNDYWTLGTGWSIGDNQAIKTGSVASNFFQYTVFTTGKTYKLNFTLSNSNDGRLLVYVGGNSVTEDITNASNGTYTFYANADGATILFRNVTFEGSITNVTAQEVIDTNNIPRINYDSNGENGHWLLEPTSTNLVTYSEDFSQSAWTKDETIIEGGYTAPDGSNTAYKITNNGSNAHLVGYNGINTGNHKSIWAKTVSGTGDVYLLNRSENNLFSLTNEWQRFDAAHLGLDYFYAVDFRGASTTLSEIIIWGAQSEALSYATSYIPTLTGSTETRATETANGAGSADLINSTEGVLYAEIAAFENTNTDKNISISDGTSPNRIGIYYYGNFMSAVGYLDGANQFYLAKSITDVKEFIKVAVKYNDNDFALWVDGEQIGTDTSGTVPSGLNSLQFDNSGGGGDFYGNCKALAVFDEALTDAELTELTS